MDLTSRPFTSTGPDIPAARLPPGVSTGCKSLLGPQFLKENLLDNLAHLVREVLDRLQPSQSDQR
jgi:hypothetical protein